MSAAGEAAWLSTLQKLPALTGLDLWVHSGMFRPDEGEEDEE